MRTQGILKNDVNPASFSGNPASFCTKGVLRETYYRIGLFCFGRRSDVERQGRRRLWRGPILERFPSPNLKNTEVAQEAIFESR